MVIENRRIYKYLCINFKFFFFSCHKTNRRREISAGTVTYKYYTLIFLFILSNFLHSFIAVIKTVRKFIFRSFSVFNSYNASFCFTAHYRTGMGIAFNIADYPAAAMKEYQYILTFRNIRYKSSYRYIIDSAVSEYIPF